MLLKRVNNLCAQDKKRKENVPSGVPYNRLLNSLVNVLDINGANDVMKTGDVTKNVARPSLEP